MTARELLEIIRAGAPDDIDEQLAERVEAVIALHKRGVLNPGEDSWYCWACENKWPCLTTRLLDGE